jgi:protoheme ferro-lyase
MSFLLVQMLFSIIMSFFIGYLFVKFLSSSEKIYPILVITTLILSILSLLDALISFSDLYKILSFVFSPITFVLGYILATYLVLKVPEQSNLPLITRSKTDKGNGHTAIIYFSHGEPENYTPVAWLRQFQEFDRQHIPFIPWAFRPFFLYSLRQHYVKVGTSHHKQEHQKIIDKLEQSYRDSGDLTTKFYLSFLDDEPHPDYAAIQAANEGASHIIVAEIFVTQSNHTHEGEHAIKQLSIPDYNIKVDFTTPLWDSPVMYRMFVEKSLMYAGETDRDKIGVLLVGHGQPHAWDREFPTETEQETQFRENIRRSLIEHGFKAELVKLAWMEFREPLVKHIAKELESAHIEKLIFFPTSISADAMHSQWDIPNMIRKANLSPIIHVINGGAWNNHPLTIQAIKEKIEFIRFESFK